MKRPVTVTVVDVLVAIMFGVFFHWIVGVLVFLGFCAVAMYLQNTGY
jgi:hypothetical protein